MELLSQEWSERLAAKPAGGQTRSTCWDGDLANEGYLSFNMKTNGWHGETGDFQLRELIFNSTLKSSFPRNSKEIEHTWAQKQYHVDLHLESLCHQKTQPQSEVIAGMVGDDIPTIIAWIIYRVYHIPRKFGKNHAFRWRFSLDPIRWISFTCFLLRRNSPILRIIFL